MAKLITNCIYYKLGSRSAKGPFPPSEHDRKIESDVTKYQVFE